MRNTIKITAFAIVLLLLSAMVLSAQEHKEMHKTDKTHQMMDVKKIDKNNDGFIYECPMKCETPTDKEGECSKCGMKLAKVSVHDTNKTAKCSDKEKNCCGSKEAKCEKSKMNKEHSKEKEHNKKEHD